MLTTKFRARSETRMKSRAFAWFLCLAIAGFFTAGAQEKETSKQAVEKRLRDVQKEKSSLAVEKAIEALAAAGSFGQVAISPDGRKVAWVEELRDKNGAETGNSAILATTTDGKAPARKITASSGQPRAEADIAWAPDSRRLAFLSDAEKPGQLQLYVDGVAGRPAKRLTNLKGFLASPKFSPDGKTIALLFTENAVRAAGPLVASAPETGEIKDAFFEQRLALIDGARQRRQQLVHR
jgi:dipeptidyl aminopeptidase/acylaminoacyl peptidase